MNITSEIRLMRRGLHPTWAKPAGYGDSAAFEKVMSDVIEILISIDESAMKQMLIKTINDTRIAMQSLNCAINASGMTEFRDMWE